MISDCCGYETALETEMQHRNDNMLLFIAIGDAVAAATEFVDPNLHAQLIQDVLRLYGYYPHPKHHDLKPGMYTDDTQMSIAVAEVLRDWMPLMRMGGHVTQQKDFAEAWVRCFHRDPRKGYAKNFQVFLESHTTADTFLQDIHPVSDKNGACMRAVPIGILESVPLVLHTAKVQAQTTHDTPIGIFSAQAVAFMSHFALHRNKPLRDLGMFMEEYFGKELSEFRIDLDQRWHGRVKNPATNTIHAVFDLLTHCSTLSEVLRGAIQFGGDTDSVAAIALGIASARMPNDLPLVLFENLESETYGREYLKALGKQLMDAYA